MKNKTTETAETKTVINLVNETLTKTENDRQNFLTFSSNEKILNEVEKFCDNTDNIIAELEKEDNEIIA